MADDDVAPAGWYTDPFERHERRYFDGGWTDRVSDNGVESADPASRVAPPLSQSSLQNIRTRLISVLLGTIVGCVLIVYEVGVAAHPHELGLAIVVAVAFAAFVFAAYRQAVIVYFEAQRRQSDQAT